MMDDHYDNLTQDHPEAKPAGASASGSPISRAALASVPVVLTVAWLFLVGWLIWQHVLRNEQPLMGDARMYWLKAHNFWNLVSAGSFVNPFDVEPTIRPPGTILMSYPFGYHESTNGFLFRSVFLPVALTAVAVHAAGSAIKTTHSRRIDIACITLFICAAPLFYHFEWAAESPTYWGLVDCFFAGTAAVAAALGLRAAVRSSQAAALGAAVFAATCYAIKPTGLFIVALVPAIWVVVTAGITFRRDPAQASSRGFLRLAAGLLIYGVIVGPIVVIGCFFSGYFNTFNIAIGNRSLVLLREDWLSTSFADLPRYIDLSVGIPIAIATVIVLACGLSRFRTLSVRDATVDSRLTPLSAFCALILIVFGLWFWLVYTGGSQLRYSYPFVLSGLVLLTPAALPLMNRVPRSLKPVLRGLLLLPALNITLLLTTTHPAPEWEKVSGVNTSTNSFQEDVQLANKLLQTVRSAGRGVRVYEDMSGAAGIIESLWGFEEIANPLLANIQMIGPLDFVRPPTYRAQEISDSDYILFPKIKDPVELRRRLGEGFIADYGAEVSLFQAWFSALDSGDGVRTFAETSALRLLEIVDRSRFDASFQKLVQERRWRAVFTEANSRDWWFADEILAHPDIVMGRDGPVDFGGVFEMRAVSVKTEADHLLVNVWWRRSTEAPMLDTWFVFSHGLDASGGILTNIASRLRNLVGANSDGKYRMQSLEVPITSGAVPTTLAMGIYRALPGPNAEPLTANRGERDWGDQRLLITLRRSAVPKPE